MNECCQIQKHFCFRCLRVEPYHVECIGSRPTTEVKQRMAWLVHVWESDWEHQVLYIFCRNNEMNNHLNCLNYCSQPNRSNSASLLTGNDYFSLKIATFIGGHSELSLMNLMQNSAKLSKFCQSENTFGNFSLQLSSCIHSYPKRVNFCWKLQNFVGGQKELKLVTLMQNSAKTTTFRQIEHDFGNFSLQASSWIQFYHKMRIFCRKVQIFVGGQNELILVTITQTSAKHTKFRQSEDVFGLLAFKHLFASIRKQINQVSPISANFCRWPKRTNFGDSHAKQCENHQNSWKWEHFWPFQLSSI